MLFSHYYYKVLRRDLLTKYFYHNLYQLPKLEKIVLSFSVSQTSLKNLVPLLTSMNLVVGQKPKILISKSIYVSVRVKRGLPVGCTVDVRGKEKFFFFERLAFSILPAFKEISMYLRSNVFFFFLPSLFVFKEIEKEYDSFLDLPQLTISFVFNRTIQSELIDFLIAFGFPLRHIKVK